MKPAQHGAPVALAVIAVLSPWFGLSGLNTTLMSTVCVYGIAATGLNLMFGYGGMLSLGSAIFMGVGAYTTAIANQTYHWPILAAAGLGVAASAAAAGVLGLPLVRLSGHYFGVATLGLSFAFSSLLLALPGAGGGTGFVTEPQVNLGVVVLASPTDWYLAGVVTAVVVVAIMGWIVAGKRGRLFRLVRNDELAAAVLGVPVMRTKLLLFTLGGALTGVGGVLLFCSQGLVSPDTVNVVTSVQLAMLVVIGGTGFRLAGLTGAFIVFWLQSGLGGFGDYELLVYGAVLLAVVLYLPGGVEGTVIAGWHRLIGQHRLIGWSPAMAPGGPERGDGLPPASAGGGAAAKGPGDLVISGVRRSFGRVVALDGVSIRVPAGSVTALIGANGAGKSTLVNVISGVESADGGTISVGGETLTGLSPAERTRLGMIRTFQVPRLVGDLSAVENIVVGHEASGRPFLRRDRRAERASLARAHATLAGLSLDHLATRPAATLSTGERKYIELARAIFSSVSVLLLDEPAVGLSAAEVDALRAWLVQLRSAGAAILIIDHNLDFIRDTADRVYSMENGRVTWSGAPADLPDTATGMATGTGTGTVTVSESAPAAAGARIPGLAEQAGKTPADAPARSGGELTVSGLSAGYGQITIIRDAHLAARSGDVLGIIGPNGAGKSTLLASIAGANPTARGEVLLDGTRLDGLAAHRRLGLGLALVPEGRQIIGSISVEANLAITQAGSGGRRGGVPYEARRDRMFALFPRLAERRAAPGSVLSGGEQQMLAIARALMTSPDVLLLDEPSQGLSPGMVAALADALSQLKRTMTIVIVEQNRLLLDQLADRVAGMRAGVLDRHASTPAARPAPDPRDQPERSGS